jgi:peptidoglycan/xylan/chitin deacetylase (PgdA/CDA1 family)
MTPMVVRESLRHQVASRISASVRPAVLGALTKTNLIIPYYHLVSDAENLYVKHLYAYKTTAQFEEDIDFLLRHYTPISLQELLARRTSDRPIDSKSFLLTFDDGFREIFDVIMPILWRKGVSATFFVNSGFVDNRDMCYLNKASLIVETLRSTQPAVRRRVAEYLNAHGFAGSSSEEAILSIPYARRCLLDGVATLLEVDIPDRLRRDQPYLTSDQIRILIEKGFAIGGHSVDHPLYMQLSLDEQLAETVPSVTELRQTFGLNYGAFAFPHHDNRVSREFFSRLVESGLVDISFGTSGLLYDDAPNHLQRFSLENPLAPAERILAFQQLRKLSKMLTGRGTIARN